jgi:hypothetical protein
MKEVGRQTLSNRVNVKHKKSRQWIPKMKDMKSGNELCEFEKKNVLEKFRQLQDVYARQKRKLGKLETRQHEATNDDRKEIEDKQTLHEMLKDDQGSIKTKQHEWKVLEEREYPSNTVISSLQNEKKVWLKMSRDSHVV